MQNRLRQNETIINIMVAVAVAALRFQLQSFCASECHEGKLGSRSTKMINNLLYNQSEAIIAHWYTFTICARVSLLPMQFLLLCGCCCCCRCRCRCYYYYILFVSVLFTNVLNKKSRMETFWNLIRRHCSCACRANGKRKIYSSNHAMSNSGEAKARAK